MLIMFIIMSWFMASGMSEELYWADIAMKSLF